MNSRIDTYVERTAQFISTMKWGWLILAMAIPLLFTGINRYFSGRDFFSDFGDYAEITCEMLVLGGMGIYLSRNIARSSRMIQELRRSEGRYRSLFGNMLEGFSLCRMVFEDGKPVDFIYLDVNDSFESLTGLKNVVGKKVTEIIPGIRESNPELFEIYGRVSLTGNSERFETYIDSLGIWFSVSVYSLAREYFVAVFDNITEPKRARELLQESEKLYRTLFESAGDCVYILDAEGERRGQIVSANSAAAEMHGYTVEEMLSLNIADLTPPESIGALHARIERILKGETLREEITHRRKDGSVFPLEINARLLELKGRRCVFAIDRDITDRTKMDAALKEIQWRQKALLDNIPDMAWLKDEESRFIAVNQPFGKACGIAPENVPGKTDFDLWPFELAERYRADDREVMVSGKRKRVEEPLTEKGGNTIWIETIKTPIYNNLGVNIGAAGIARDITERKRAEETLRLSEERYRRLFEDAPLIYVITRNDGGVPFISDCNDLFPRSLGYKREEVQGKPLADFYSPESRAELFDRGGYARALAGEYFMGERELMRRDGSILPTLLYTATEVNASGQVIGTRATFVDITESKLAEEARLKFLERQDRLNRLQQSLLAPGELAQKLKMITDGVVNIFGADFCRIWRVGPGDLCERKCAHASVTEEPHVCKYRDKCLHLLASSGRYTHTDGLTHRRVPFGAYKIGGVAAGREHKFLTNDVAHDPRVHNHDWARELGLVSFAGYQLRPPDGEAIGVLALFSKHALTEEEDAQLDALSSATAQVLHAAEGEEKLKDSEEKFRDFFMTSRDCVFIASISGVWIDFNDVAPEMFGYESREEFLRVPIPRLYEHPKDSEKFARLVVEKGYVKEYPIRVRRKDGTVLDTLVTATARKNSDGSPTVFAGAIRDVTQSKRMAKEKEQLQEQLLQSQKMEAVGTLAGGVAHDFNNILQVTLGYSELILADDDLPERYRADLRKVHESAKRGADLVQRLLTFSRKTEIKPQPLNLNRRINEMRKMLDRTIPKMIEIQLVPDADPAVINADPTQVDQVLMNLAVNARDAMPEGGKLVIETADTVIDEEYARTHLDAKPGPYVLLTVTDTGAGMDKETLEHIFEPFYTTKESGQGTGLGLAVVLGIVQQHGGLIKCYSEPGHGTTFKIYFPALVSEPEPTAPAERVIPRGGSETILLVDDEEFIRELGSRILTRAGYKVITASQGKEALEMYKKGNNEISLVILDLIMPEMGGKQCMEGLLRINPAVKVIIASGYSAESRTKETLASGAKGIVNKPYNIREVLEAVRSALDDNLM